MSSRYVGVFLGACLLVLTAGCRGGAKEDPRTSAGGGNTAAAEASGPAISGTIEGGLRTLVFDQASPAPEFRVYRGDYVQIGTANGEPLTIVIDTLGVTWSFPVAEGDSPYFKLPDAGRFPFRIGAFNGVFEVIEYTAIAYREVSSTDAAALLANLQPFVLDVRTGGEFAGGHLAGATLIPVQELQRRLGELAEYKRAPLFVYCQTGNRSTVAAKLLIDAGFEQVINLRRGIAEWKKAGLPTER